MKYKLAPLFAKSFLINIIVAAFLLIPLSHANESIPAKGMQMDAVRAQFGQARKENPAIGKPAIIRWDYNNYSVYFEDEYVIHSVSHKSASKQADKPEQEKPLKAKESAKEKNSTADAPEQNKDDEALHETSNKVNDETIHEISDETNTER